MSNSTIKLKSSATAGNTPSSLETGEFAINIADGNLFYGSASAVKQDLVLETLTVKGSLTAENYIVSSSVTHMTQSFSSGSTIFGDSIDDTHLFTGSLKLTGSTEIIGGVLSIPGFANVSSSLAAASAGGISAVVDDTSPQLGGDLDANGKNIGFGDNDSASFGAAGDLKIYHDGSDSFIKDTGTGDLKIHASTLKISDADGSPDFITVSNSSFNLRPANGIINISNNKIGNGTDEEYIEFSATDIDFHVEDTQRLRVGDGFVAVSGSFNTTGSVDINGTLSIPGFANVSSSLAAASAGGDNLGNHTATQDLNMGGNAITSVGNVDGVDVSTLNSSFNTLEGKTLVSGSAQTVANLDTQNVVVGSLNIKSAITDSFRIQNSGGTTTYVNFSPQGGLEVDLGGTGNSISASQDIKTHGDFIGANTHIRLTNPDGGGGSGLYLSSSGDLQGSSFKIFAGDIGGVGQGTLLTVDDANEQITTSKALGVTGNITVTGTVDGRDVAADGIKLDGITAAGISGSFTAASSSFSTRVTANDAKLTANTSNVTSAGALMDSELAEIATVKALTKAGISGSFTAASASFSTRVTTNGAASASFSTRVTANDAKLTANTSNVTSAGALMDSELSNLAAVKAINQGLTTTSNVTFNDVDVDGTLSLPGFANVSSSLAAAVAGGDNLGNHTATTNLDLNGNSIHSALHITASGNISSSGKVTSNTLDVDGFISLGGVNSVINNSGTITFGNISNVTQIRSSEAISMQAITTANITASSDISASGFVSASEFIGDGSGLTNVSATLPSGVVSGSAQIADVTLTTAAQTNITSLGSLTALDVNGNADIDGTLTVGTGPNTGFDVTFISDTTNGASWAYDASADVERLVGDSEITGSLKINPASATDNEVLFEISVGGTQKVFIDEDGDAGFDGSISCNTLSVSSDGSQSSPAIKFGTDINTGIYQPADNQIALQANGSTTELTVSTAGVEVTNGSLIAPKIKLSKTSATDGDHDGDVVFFGGTTSMQTGRIYHFKSDGTWEIANPNATSTSDGLLGVALGAASDTNGVLLKGMVTLDHDPGAVGDVLYLDEQQVSSVYGAATSGAPAGNGDVVRIIGYCLDASDGQIYFNPSNDFIVITA